MNCTMLYVNRPQVIVDPLYSHFAAAPIDQKIGGASQGGFCFPRVLETKCVVHLWQR